MKTFKISITIVSIIMLCSLPITSCGQKEEPLYSEEMISENAEKFLQAICDKNYSEVINLSYLPNSSHIVPEDIEAVLPETTYSYIFGNEDTIKEIQISEDIKTLDGNKIAHASILDAEGNVLAQYDISFIQNETHEWRIHIPDFYITDWQIKTCGGNAVLCINGEPVSDISYENIKDNFGGNLDTYRIYHFGAIGKATKTFSIRSDNFQEESLEITPGTDNDVLLRPLMNEEESTKLLSDIKNAWNGLYTLFSEGNDYEAALDYFAEGTDASTVEAIWQDFIVLSENGNEFKITDIYLEPSDECFFYTDTLAVANFSYRSQWSSGSMTEHSSIIMIYEEGKYRIAIIPYEKFFYYASAE